MRDWQAFVEARLRLARVNPARQARLVNEVAAQLEDVYRDAVLRGAGEEEADRLAREHVRDWGSLAFDLARADRPGTIVGHVVRDLAYGTRLLGRNKAFTLTATLTLALCMAANVAIFSLVNAVVLRPFAFPGADRLVTVYNSLPKGRFERAGNDVGDHFDRLTAVATFEHQAIFAPRGVTIGSAGVAERVRGITATPSLFRVLETRAHRGRLFTEDDGRVGQHRKAILSYGLWQRLFAGGDDAIGRELRVNDQPHLIVGVLGPDFHFPAEGEEPQLYVPAAFTPEQQQMRFTAANYAMIARLKPGATLSQAQREIDTLNKRNLERFPMFKAVLTQMDFHTHVVGTREDLIREVRGTLYMLWAGAAFVLLISVVNVATLALVRATGRMKEFATRHILGASRGRLARQVLTETTLVAVAGGALGLLLGYWTLRLISRLGLERLPRSGEIGIDATVVLLTLALSLVLGVLLGLAPVVSIRGPNLSQAFHEEGRSNTGGRRTRLVRSTLVTAQVAVALMLLVGAGLLFASFWHVLSIDPGFTSDNVVTGRVTLPSARYTNRQAVDAFARRVLEGVRVLPGITRASVSSLVPFGDSPIDGVMTPEGHVMQPGESPTLSTSVTVSDGYFEAMRIGLVRGRFFDGRDAPNSLPVIIVDETLARRFWPHDDPIGKRMYSGAFAPGPNTRYSTVVGIVRDVKYGGLVPPPGANPVGTHYEPVSQVPVSSIYLVARTDGDPQLAVAGLRKAVSSIDPGLPLWEPLTMGERRDRSLITRRTPMLLALAFAGVALLLASVGVYGALAYQVTQRTREIGVRMALGAGLPVVFRLVLGDGLRMVGTGVAIGLAGAFVTSRALQSQLFGVRALDPFVLSIVAALLGLVALVACIVPAMRAARIDPVRALNEL